MMMLTDTGAITMVTITVSFPGMSIKKVLTEWWKVSCRKCVELFSVGP